MLPKYFSHDYNSVDLLMGKYFNILKLHNSPVIEPDREDRDDCSADVYYWRVVIMAIKRNKKKKYIKKMKSQMGPIPVSANGNQPAMTESQVSATNIDIAANRNTPADEEWARLIRQLGTELWRLKMKMVDQSGEPLEEMKRAYRHLKSALDLLADAGFEISDHIGKRYDQGMLLDVIAFQLASGIESDTIIETIKPSIYYCGKPIQSGEVIVATPMK